jgi:hypothetical protein
VYAPRLQDFATELTVTLQEGKKEELASEDVLFDEEGDELVG